MTQEAFDTLFDNIVSRLEAYAASEASQNPALGFEVKPDNIRALGEAQNPAWVLPRVDRLDFDAETSAVGEEHGVTAAYAIDCIVRAGRKSETAGREAFSRLRYLVTQVIRALWHRDHWDLGMPEHIHRALPQVNWIAPEISQTERAIIGATVTLEAGLTFDLGGPTGTDADSILVDIDEWSALFEYGG